MLDKKTLEEIKILREGRAKNAKKNKNDNLVRFIQEV